MSWLVLWSILEWTIRIVMVPVVLRRRFAPVTSLAWLSIIFFLPAVGLVLYLLVGVSYLGRRRARWHRAVVGAARRPDRMAEMRSFSFRPEVLPAQENMIVQAERISGNPIVGGNSVELIHEADDVAARIAADIDAATDHVHLLYYIFWPDKNGKVVAEALQRAAKRGVTCRLLADSSGSRPLFRNVMLQDLRSAGVKVQAALPVTPWRRKLARLDLRNHRKIAIIDGRTGYTGSHNVVVEDYGSSRRAGRWVDLTGRFQGPVVAQLQMVFLDDWAYETGDYLQEQSLFPPLRATAQVAAQVVPTGPNHEAETFRRVLVAALNAAHRKIIITTPYLVPDEPTTLALAMAADRGVQVIVVVPERSDHPLVEAAARWYFEQLLDAGVEIHHYCDGMLHAKTITVDDAFALLGSANIDIRSFYLNFELSVLLYGQEITARLRASQERYLKSCTQLSLETWRQRPALSKYVESAAALFSPLL